MPVLPPITSSDDILSALRIWRSTLNNTLKRVMAPPIPWNFSVTNKRGGNLLSWTAVAGADGYEILRADNADFSANVTTIPLPSHVQTQYFDAIAIQGTSLPTKYYKIRSTAGTTTAPQSVKGGASTIISSTPIDPSDTATASTTNRDTVTDDNVRIRSAKQSYLLYGP